MFSSKANVDEHVKKLLSLSKDHNDNVKQFNKIAKLYFDIKEFAVAKSYILKYTKFQSNNLSAWELKALIHERLEEYDYALNSYEQLYLLNKSELCAKKIVEMLQSIPKVSDSKVKYWMQTIEKDFKGKLMFGDMSNGGMSDAEFLELQEKVGENEKALNRYLAALSAKKSESGTLERCIELMEQQKIEKFESCRLLLSVFRNSINNEGDCDSHRLYHSVALLKYLHFIDKIDEFGLEQCLTELLNLLILLNNSTFLPDLAGQFLYFLSCVTHIRLASFPSGQYKCSGLHVAALLQCYSSCRDRLSSTPSDMDSSAVSVWLQLQRLRHLAVCEHILRPNCDSDANSNISWMELVTGIVWPKEKQANILDSLNRICSGFPHVESRSLQSIIAPPNGCESDFDLLMFHLSCINPDTDNNHDLSPEAARSISKFVRSLFQNSISVECPSFPSTRPPQNLAQIDVVAFILAALVSYQTSLRRLDSTTPLLSPPEIANSVFPDFFSSWWTALCDYALEKRRLTSIGVMRELLKHGLETMQCSGLSVSGNAAASLPDASALRTAHLLLQYARSTGEEAASRRSEMLYRSVLTSMRSLALHILPFKQQQPYLYRQQQHCYFLGPDDEKQLNDWRKEGGLLILETELREGANLSDKTFSPGVDQMLKELEPLFEKCAQFHLLKVQYLLRLSRPEEALVVAQRGCRLVETASRTDDTAHSMYKQFIGYVNELTAPIPVGKAFSTLNFSINSETSNSNQMCTPAAVPAMHRLENVDNIASRKMDEVEERLMQLDLGSERLRSGMTACMKAFRDMNGSLSYGQNERSVISSHVDRQNRLYANMAVQVQTLYGKMHKLECKNEVLAVENEQLRQTVESLMNQDECSRLERRIRELEIRQNAQDYCNQLTNCIQQPLADFGRDSLDKLYKTSQILKQVESRQTQQYTINKNQSALPSSSQPTETRASSTFDLSRFSAGKWQCPTCSCMNDNKHKSCPACTTQNPSTASLSNPETEVVSRASSTFDMSRFSDGKWQCPTCSCMNDNKHKSCPACTTQNPEVAASTEVDSPILFGKSQSSDTDKLSNVSLPFNLSSSSVGAVIKFGFSSSPMSKVELTVKAESDVKPLWTCNECTTVNNADKTTCIACGNGNNIPDYEGNSEISSHDSDVLITHEPYVTQEQINRAKALQLPFYFFYFENLSDLEEQSDEDTQFLPQHSSALKGHLNKGKCTDFACDQNNSGLFSNIPSSIPSSNIFADVQPNQHIPNLYAKNETPTSTVNLFGNNTSNGSIFGNSQNPVESKSLGNKAANSLFGDNSTSTKLFGNTSGSSPSTVNPFGNNTSNGSIFGNLQNPVESKSLGNKAANSLFGDNSTSTKLFGNTSGSSQGTVNLFGNNISNGSIFGNSQNPVESKSLGNHSANSLFGDNSTSAKLFGNMSASSPSTVNPFGNSSSLFGQKDGSTENVSKLFGNVGKLRNSNLFGETPQVNVSDKKEPINLFTSKSDSTSIFISNPSSSTAESSSLFKFNLESGSAIKLVEATTEKEDESEPGNDHDPQFEPIVQLEKVKLITGEEGYDVEFSERAKLYLFGNGEWKECCLGPMKILKMEKESTTEGRLLMRQEIVEIIRCNQKVTREIPNFVVAKEGKAKNMVCWFAMDFSKEEPTKVQMMIKFKTGDICEKFVDTIKKIQENLSED